MVEFDQRLQFAQVGRAAALLGDDDTCRHEVTDRVDQLVIVDPHRGSDQCGPERAEVRPPAILTGLDEVADTLHETCQDVEAEASLIPRDAGDQENLVEVVREVGQLVHARSVAASRAALAGARGRPVAENLRSHNRALERED